MKRWLITIASFTALAAYFVVAGIAAYFWRELTVVVGLLAVVYAAISLFRRQGGEHHITGQRRAPEDYSGLGGMGDGDE